MSRIAAGLWIVRDPHGEVVENVICGLPEMARASAEERLELDWDTLVKLGYSEVETDIWSLH